MPAQIPLYSLLQETLTYRRQYALFYGGENVVLANSLMYNTLSVGITRLCRRGGAGRCSQYVESKAIPLHLLLVVLLHLLHAGHLQKGAQTIEILPRHLHLPLAGQNLSHIVQDGLVDGRPKLRHGCRLTFGQERQRHLVRGKGFLGRRGVPTAVEGVDVMRQGHVEHLDCQKFRAGFSALLGREVGMGLKGFGTVVRIEQYRPGVHDEAAMVVHAMGKGGGRRLVLRVQRLNVRLNLADGLVRLGDDGAVILGGDSRAFCARFAERMESAKASAASLC